MLHISHSVHCTSINKFCISNCCFDLLTRRRVIDHYVTRVKGQLQLMDRLDIVGRTSELARLFGIEFYAVLSRGSQFRVESMMLRMLKPNNYIAVSPSAQQRAR